MQSSAAAIATLLLPMLVGLAAASDLAQRKIPNAVTFALASSFILVAVPLGLNFANIASHCLCAIAVLAFTLPLYARSLLGAGDAKLLAAVALWFGFDHLTPLLVGVSLAGGVLALLQMTFRLASASHVEPTSALPSALPYAIAIAAGTLIAFPGWAVSI